VRALASERDVALFADLHGHSKRANVFLYGVDGGTGGSIGGGIGGASTPPDALGGVGGLAGWVGATEPGDRRLLPRVLPYVLWRSSRGAFSYADTSFTIKRSKEATGRVVVHRELGVGLSYTVEATYAGPSAGPLAGVHFSSTQLAQLGAHFCGALLECANPLVQVDALRELRALHGRRAGGGGGLAAAAGWGVVGGGGGGNESQTDTSSDDEDELPGGRRQPPAVRRVASGRAGSNSSGASTARGSRPPVVQRSASTRR
jgi:hypothetical protein